MHDETVPSYQYMNVSDLVPLKQLESVNRIQIGRVFSHTSMLGESVVFFVRGGGRVLTLESA